MIRLWPYLALAVACMSIGAGLAHAIDQSRYKKLELQHLKYQRDAAQALADAQARALADQEAQRTRISQIEQQSQTKAQNDEKVIADLRAKYSGLRILTRCPTATSLPKAIDTSERVGTGSGEVVPRAIGSDLIDFAADAERVRGQLIACQAVVRSIQ